MPGAGGLSLPGGLDLSSLGINVPAGELDDDDDDYDDDDDDEDET
jgi:hypothetical protein